MRICGVSFRSAYWKCSVAMKSKETYTVFLIILIVAVAYYCHEHYIASNSLNGPGRGGSVGNYQGFVDERMQDKLKEVYRNQAKVENKPQNLDMLEDLRADVNSYNDYPRFDSDQYDQYHYEGPDNYQTDIENVDPDDNMMAKNRLVGHVNDAAIDKMLKSNMAKVNNATSNDTCAKLKPPQKFDCHPEAGVTEKKCLARGCCWNEDPSRQMPLKVPEDDYSKQSPVDVPFCYYPKGYPGYMVTDVSETDVGFKAFIAKGTLSSSYPGDVKYLAVDVIYETNSILHVKITDARNNKRYQVPLDVPKTIKKAENPAYKVLISKAGTPFGLTVKRDGSTSNKTIFSTKNVAPLIYTDQFLQLSSMLSTPFVYGLGEHRGDLMNSVNWTRHTMWARDQVPREKTNLYGVHPFYMVMEADGSSNGFFLLNSNAMDVVLQPYPAITWRTIGGILDFYIFLGPTPKDITRQYTSIIGRPFMPPYWSLGFHICRWGYKNVNDTMAVVDGMRKAGIPQDTQWNDIDYMNNYRDFTRGKEFKDQKELEKTIHFYGMKYVVIVDPGIPYNVTKGEYKPLDLGLDMDVFFKNDSGGLLVGEVWPGKTVFPDFTHPNSQDYWNNLISEYLDELPVDGLWIDMNEIANFVNGSVDGCPDTKYDSPPYVPAVYGGKLKIKTLCPSAKGFLSREYDIHNIYGLKESQATYQALKTFKNTRPFVISRSTYSGQGRFGGHWSGDNLASFHDMYRSISELLTMSLFGVPMSGADICGFRGNTTYELCLRWHQLGAFYPFSRNHNHHRAILSMNLYGIPMSGADICGFKGDTTYELCLRWHQLGAFYPFSRNHNDFGMNPQEPFRFDEKFSKAVRDVYLTRYSLLPYLYTLFYFSHINGDTVARPMFQEFPLDRIAYPIDSQFMWGSALMIVPVLQEGEILAYAYLPHVSKWYDFYTGFSYKGGQVIKMQAPFDKINLLLRGGSIIPMQKPAQTTSESRLNDFSLLCGLSIKGTGFGVLYWDDGESLDTYGQKAYNEIEFHVNQSILYSKVIVSGYEPKNTMMLSSITLYGVQGKPVSININRRSQQYSYDAQLKVLKITALSPKINLLQEFKLEMTGVPLQAGKEPDGQANQIAVQNKQLNQQGLPVQQPGVQQQQLGQGGLQGQPSNIGQGQQPLNLGQIQQQQQSLNQGQQLPLNQGEGQRLRIGQGQQPLYQGQNQQQQSLNQGQSLPIGQGQQPLYQGQNQQQQSLNQGQRLPIGQGQQPNQMLPPGQSQRLPIGQGQQPNQLLPLGQGQRPTLNQGQQPPLNQGQPLGQGQVGQSQPSLGQGTQLRQNSLLKQHPRLGQGRPFDQQRLGPGPQLGQSGSLKQSVGAGQQLGQNGLLRQPSTAGQGQQLGQGGLNKQGEGQRQQFGQDGIQMGRDGLPIQPRGPGQQLGQGEIRQQQTLGQDQVRPFGQAVLPRKQQMFGQNLGQDGMVRQPNLVQSRDGQQRPQQPRGQSMVRDSLPIRTDGLRKGPARQMEQLGQSFGQLGRSQSDGNRLGLNDLQNKFKKKLEKHRGSVKDLLAYKNLDDIKERISKKLGSQLGKDSISKKLGSKLAKDVTGNKMEPKLVKDSIDTKFETKLTKDSVDKKFGTKLVKDSIDNKFETKLAKDSVDNKFGTKLAKDSVKNVKTKLGKDFFDNKVKTKLSEDLLDMKQAPKRQSENELGKDSRFKERKVDMIKDENKDRKRDMNTS